MTDTQTLNLPQDLVAELSRRAPTPRTDFRVEGWKPSLFGRIVEILTGKRG